MGARDMTEREFKAALDRQGIRSEIKMFGVRYYTRGLLSVPADTRWSRRQTLGHLIRKFEAHEAEEARKVADRKLRDQILENFANGVTP